MRIVFMGTPGFALPTLTALHQAGGGDTHQIVAVYSQPPRPAGRGQKEKPSVIHQYAQEYHIPVHTPTTLKTPEVQAEFAAHKADVAIVASYGLLLPKPILEAYPFGCINIHPSLLPRWRGAAPIHRTLMAGDTNTGICIMQMDEGLDTGNVLAVQPYTIPDGTNTGTLHDTLAGLAAPLLESVLVKLQNGTVKSARQPDTGVTYAKKITKDECRIHWKQSAEKIYHQIKGLSPTPGAYIHFGDEIIKVFDATYDMALPTVPAGTTTDAYLSIACEPGTLFPTILQRPNKKRMMVDEFLNGHPIPAGTKFE